MHSVTVKQKAFLGAVVALALLVGSLLLVAPKASASMSECAENHVCIWEKGSWTGTFSQWSASETGCHNHIFNPTFRSLWNRTSKNVHFGDAGSIPSGEAVSQGAGELSYEGEICWT
jgi:hypothetical protein